MSVMFLLPWYWFCNINSCLSFHRLFWSQAPSLNQKRSLRLLITRCLSPRWCNGINKPEGGVFSPLCTAFIIDLWNKLMFLKLSPWMFSLNHFSVFIWYSVRFIQPWWTLQISFGTVKLTSERLGNIFSRKMYLRTLYTGSQFKISLLLVCDIYLRHTAPTVRESWSKTESQSNP